MLAILSCAWAMLAAGQAHVYSEPWGAPQHFAPPSGMGATEQVFMRSQPSVIYDPVSHTQTYQRPPLTYQQFQQQQPFATYELPPLTYQQMAPQMQTAPQMAPQMPSQIPPQMLPQMPRQIVPQVRQPDPSYHYQSIPLEHAPDFQQQLQVSQPEDYLQHISDAYGILLPTPPTVQFGTIPRALKFSSDLDKLLQQRQEFEAIASSYVDGLQKRFSKTRDILLSQEKQVMQDLADHIDLKVDTTQALIDLEFDREAELLASHFAARRTKVEKEIEGKNAVQQGEAEQQFQVLFAKIRKTKEEQLEATRQAASIQLEKFRTAADLVIAYTAIGEVDTDAVEAEYLDMKQSTETNFEDEIRKINGDYM